jgi:hypothetical protein
LLHVLPIPYYIHKITNLFKDTNLKIAFKSTTTLNNFLTNRQKTHIRTMRHI